MDRRKGYRALMLVLLFAFISLVSRSLIYLLISITIAAIILFLLSKDVKEKQAEAGKAATKGGRENQPVRKKSGMFLPISFTVLGVVMASYGLTGIFEVESIFVKMHLMVEEPFVLFSSIIIGLLLAFYGLVQTIKKWLE